DVSAEEGGRLLSAIGNALEIFGPGDVLSFSIGPAGCGTLASDPATWTLMRLASDLGVTCVISAGNDCCDLQDNPQFGGVDCGATIVGATYPGCDAFDGLVLDLTPHNCFCRIYFSNFCTTCDVADAVHIGGWGDAVMTIGCSAAFDTQCLDVYVGSSNNPWNRSYTNIFGGTSAAAPMVAALVANLQGISKQFFGIPLMPEEMRSIVSGVGADWVNQCAPLPNPPGNVAPPAGGTCPPGNHSWSDWNQGAGENRIGWNASNSLTNAFAAAASVITGGWFDGNGLLTGEIEILRGTHIFGNSFSIRSPDDNYLVIRSQYTVPGDKAPSSLPKDPVYTGFGQITDVLVHAQADIANVNALVVRVESYVSNGTGILMVELYDWIANFWAFTGFGLTGSPDPDLFFEYPVSLEPHRFVRESDDKIVIRVWTLALGGSGGIGGVPGDEYRVFHDWIWIGVGESFADIEDPP
ncbi:MAG: S8 family serine peptidase, partial [Planctomycetota bacterium]